MKNQTVCFRQRHRGSILWVLFALPVLGAADCSGGFNLRLPDPNVRVIAFGSSTTAGPSTMQYVDYLPDLLSEPANAFANEGLGGETTTDGVPRLQGLLDAEYFPNADTLIYWQGGNDVIDFIQAHDPLIAISPNSGLYLFNTELQALLATVDANLRAAINAGKASGLNIYLATFYFIPEEIFDCAATPLDVIFPGQAAVANDYIELLNQRIRDAAAAEGATLIDIAALDATLRADLANYFNCNHLSAVGNQIAAQRIAEVLQGS